MRRRGDGERRWEWIGGELRWLRRRRRRWSRAFGQSAPLGQVGCADRPALALLPLNGLWHHAGAVLTAASRRRHLRQQPALAGRRTGGGNGGGRQGDKHLCRHREGGRSDRGVLFRCSARNRWLPPPRASASALMLGRLPWLRLGAAAAAVGGYVGTEYQAYLALRADAAVEAHLPEPDVARSTQVVRIPRLLTDEEIASVHELYARRAGTQRTGPADICTLAPAVAASRRRNACPPEEGTQPALATDRSGSRRAKTYVHSQHATRSRPAVHPPLPPTPTRSRGKQANSGRPGATRPTKLRPTTLACGRRAT